MKSAGGLVAHLDLRVVCDDGGIRVMCLHPAMCRPYTVLQAAVDFSWSATNMRSPCLTTAL
jgi:hypothetical protein